MISKSSLVNETRLQNALTANGAVTNSTTLNSVLDLFFLAGACRTQSEDVIFSALERAFLESPSLTLKVVLWAGDIREGAGERRFFQVAMKWLYATKPIELFNRVGTLIPAYNRWDSLFQFTDSDFVMSFVYANLIDDVNNNQASLLAKWMPREGKSKYQDFRKAFQKKYKLSSKEYRKLIVKASKTVEQQMSANKWSEIKYSGVPSVAFKNYSKAFGKHDQERFAKFFEKVEAGEEKINAGAIFPHDILRPYIKGTSLGQDKAIDLQWQALPNYLKGSDVRFLPVCDVSGSMSGTPMEISISLGIYLSERNTSIFKDAFITFSSRPTMQYLTGSLKSKVDQLEKAAWERNTDLQATFRLILDKATAAKIPAEEMPTHLLIISDMEFDNAAGNVSNFDAIKAQYAASGYELPNIVFWNVDGREGNLPSSAKDSNTALISGASPSIIKGVLSGKVTPLDALESTLNIERYSLVDSFVLVKRIND